MFNKAPADAAPSPSPFLLPCPAPSPSLRCRASRTGCSCGIASDAAFAEVSPQHVVPGAAERARALVLAASNDA